MESDEEESIIFAKKGRNSKVVNRQQDPDIEFDGEFGYSLVKALRGRSIGRKIKRNLFKLGCFEFICGITLLILTIEASQNFTKTSYYDSPNYGATLIDLMWLISFPTCILSIVNMLAVRNWASLTTNRTLLGGLLRVYLAVCFGMFVFTLWFACALFMTFGHIKDWNSTVQLASMYPYFVCTSLFLMPYLAAQVYYWLDLTFLIEEMDRGGSIEEPDPPANVMDLSDVSLFQSCIFVCGMPCIVCLQITDLCSAVRKAYSRHYKNKPLVDMSWWNGRRSAYKNNNIEEEEQQPKKKPRRLLRRIAKTVNRWFRGTKQKEVRPETMEQILNRVESGAGPQTLELADLQVDREEQERLEREKALKESEERQRQREQAEAAAAAHAAAMAAEAEAERQRLAEEQLQEAARVMNERKQRDEEERIKLEEANRGWNKTLSVTKYKALWSTLPTAGSFQCNLKNVPMLTKLTEHLQKQGFHIVFAAQAGPEDVEVGVCNERATDNETWFMARFVATRQNFSAVMKSENAEQVTGYVKKFALAKVLEIDTSAK